MEGIDWRKSNGHFLLVTHVAHWLGYANANAYLMACEDRKNEVRQRLARRMNQWQAAQP